MRLVPDIAPLRLVCPEHGISDCSPLLNGCSYLINKVSIDEAIDSHPVGKGVPAERRALLDAQKWSNRIVIAREGYSEALVACREQGLSNAEIARAVGKSETAIRMYFKRRAQPTELDGPDPLQMTIDDMESEE